MTVFLRKPENRVILSFYGGGGDQPRVRMVDVITPGWKLYGKTYEEWAALPPGEYEVPADHDPNDDHPPPGVGIPA